MFSENDAFEFFISRIKKQAEMENISLSDEENKMLRFSVGSSDEQLLQLGEKFEDNMEEYETKVVNLLRKSYDSGLFINAHTGEQEHIKQQYMEASKKLKENDNYITVMIDQVVKPKDFFKKLFG